jgi:hypothetical protein
MIMCRKKSRYISIQVGIGGWKPMLATDTMTGYGDRKSIDQLQKHPLWKMCLLIMLFYMESQKKI